MLWGLTEAQDGCYDIYCVADALMLRGGHAGSWETLSYCGSSRYEHAVVTMTEYRCGGIMCWVAIIKSSKVVGPLAGAGPHPRRQLKVGLWRRVSNY
jgi:hypothetical protein